MVHPHIFPHSQASRRSLWPVRTGRVFVSYFICARARDARSCSATLFAALKSGRAGSPVSGSRTWLHKLRVRVRVSVAKTLFLPISNRLAISLTSGPLAPVRRNLSERQKNEEQEDDYHACPLAHALESRGQRAPANHEGENTANYP